MFRKILVANRGEIAVRIISACRELGVQVIAVYSDVDRCALHVRRSDEAYYIGPAPARESYLCVDRIVETARQSGAEAIHPGYGFLAENPALAQACADAGITFIGPSPAAIAAMGDKVAARRAMVRAGVQVIPGTDADLDDEAALRQAAQIGFPLFVKAAAGGGRSSLTWCPDEASWYHGQQPRPLQVVAQSGRVAGAALGLTLGSRQPAV